MIKLAYEWIGPAGPISNNDFPNLYNIRRQFDHFTDWDYPTCGPSLKEFLSELYDVEITPVSEIKDKDFFLYEINIDYKYPFVFDSFFMSSVTPRIKHLLNSDRSNGYYAFNTCLEGWSDSNFLNRLYEGLRKRQINTNKVILFTGAINAQALHDEWALRNRIDKPIKIVSCNGYYRVPRKRLNNKKPRAKKFLCFNRRWKPHRVLLYVYLHKHKLLDHFYFSMSKENVSNPGDSFHRYAEDLINRRGYSGLGLTIDDVNAAYNDLPMILDDGDFEKINWWDNSKLTQYYNDSYISIVTETCFESQEVFPTEKSFNPMSYGHPIIVIGTPGFLNGIRSLGFKTFSNTIDESYDEITNNGDRLMKIINMITEMCSWPESKFEELVTNTQTDCLHNYHLLSTNVPKDITVQQLGKIYDNR